MKWLGEGSSVSARPGMVFAVYGLVVFALVARVAYLDEWTVARWAVLLAFVATVGPDRIREPTVRALVAGVAFFAGLTWVVTYLPELWFGIAYLLNHAKNYLWNVNETMKGVPFNSGEFIWSHQFEPLTSLMRWIYINGFDMVVWIPVVRSLAACDPRKVARYSLGAHVIQFPLIIPFYSAFRVDEVWSVLGHPDRCLRGWNDEVRLSLGANCFPSMHTSVAFAVWLMSRGEKSRVFRTVMPIYAASIIFSTVYMEIHWLIDLAGGFALGAVSVTLADWVLSRHFKPREGAAAAPSVTA